MRKQLIPVSDILAYCLMPNHFHWLLLVKDMEEPYIRQPAQSGQADLQQESRSGSLFRQKTKAVEIDSTQYGLPCIKHIHQNPLKAGLVKNLGNWEFLSFPDYANLRKGAIVNKVKAKNIFGSDLNKFISQSRQIIDRTAIDKLT